MTAYTTIPVIQKNPITAWEKSPFVLNGDLYVAGFKRGWTTTAGAGVIIEKYDATLQCFYKVGFIPWGRYLGSALSHNGKVYLTGSGDVSVAGNSVYIREVDPLTWTFVGSEVLVATAPAGKKFYNSSICEGPDKFVMLIETDEGVPFSMRAVQSTDLTTWTPLGSLMHGNFYSACPTIRYGADGYYLITYLWNNNGTYLTAICRTNNFTATQNFSGNSTYTPYQIVGVPGEIEGKNSSDWDFIEWNGKVYFTYLTGDQQTWAYANDAWYDGTMLDFYREYWP